MANNIDNILKENRKFSPSEEFKKNALISSKEEYQKMYNESIQNPEAFWGKVAEELHWFKYE